MKGTSVLFVATAAMSVLAADPTPYEKCPAIKDAGKRLQCYDAAYKQTATAARHAESEKATREKEEHSKAEAGRMERTAIERAASIAAAKDALKGLKKLQVRVETGVSYRDYPTVLSDAKFEVRQFNDSPGAKQLPEFSAAINSAIRHYERAQALWAYKFADRELRNAVLSYDIDVVREGGLFGGSFKTVNRVNPTRLQFMTELMNEYKVGDGSSPEVRIMIDSTLAVIWSAAAKDIDTANSLLPS